MPWTIIGNIVVAVLPRLISLFDKKEPAPGQGPQKKAEVKEIIMATVEGIEGGTGRDIFNDAEVDKAYDAMNDAIVAFQNLLAKKGAKPAVP